MDGPIVNAKKEAAMMKLRLIRRMSHTHLTKDKEVPKVVGQNNRGRTLSSPYMLTLMKMFEKETSEKKFIQAVKKDHIKRVHAFALGKSMNSPLSFKKKINVKNKKPGDQKVITINISQNLSDSEDRVRQKLQMSATPQYQNKVLTMKNYADIFPILYNRTKTFSRFVFKSYEVKNNPKISPILKCFSTQETNGSMNVIEMWPDQNISQFLGNCKLVKDKLFLLKLANNIKKRKMF